MAKYFIIFITMFFIIQPLAFADALVLKSGQKIEGNIVEQTDQYVMIRQADGDTSKYFNKDISAIYVHSMCPIVSGVGGGMLTLVGILVFFIFMFRFIFSGIAR